MSNKTTCIGNSTDVIFCSAFIFSHKPWQVFVTRVCPSVRNSFPRRAETSLRTTHFVYTNLFFWHHMMHLNGCKR